MEFMIDTGLTTEMVTPHLQHILYGDKKSKYSTKGLGAGGSTSSALIPLRGVSLCCLPDQNTEPFQLPDMTAVVTDFPQEHVDPQHDIEGKA